MTFLFFRSGRAIRSFSMLMLGITIWSIAYAFELASTSLDEMLFWIDIEYIGIALMPGFWLLFCIQFIGYESYLSRKKIFLIFLLPAVTLLLVWTNEFHRLHYSSTSVVETEGLNLLRLETGVWYIVHTIIFYSYLLAGIGFLLKKYVSTNHLIKKQITMIFVAASVPWVANVTYLIGYRPLEYIDTTPYAFAISGIFISAGLVWFRLFEILPVAREKIIEQTKDGILILNNTFQILDANAAAIDIIENNFDKSLIGEIASDVFADHKEVLRLFKESDYKSCEWKINIEGDQKYFEINLNHFLNSRGVTSGYFIVFKDVTKNKKNQAELIAARKQAETASKAKSEFLSHMGHEIRTPLAGIIGFVDLMKSEDLNDDIKEYVSIVGTSARSLLNIVNEILDLTKIESGSLKLIPESTNIEKLCKEAMDLFAWQASADPLKMYYTIAPDVPESIHADKTKLRQVLINIIGNAVKFTDEGEIALTVERSNHNPQHIRFSVSDTGIGIAKEDQEKIFESFTQLRNKIGSKKNVVGTGLGLTISNKLLNLMDSKLQLESKLGEGSTFYFEIEIEGL
ncbi:histidine kinase N-terminal 7TM domain-containing protein [Gracilimonas sp.]|uniref:histidine kinase N-terminal 7TM domain-containing protein n=1 Tax=Gracilimonas sp. TaxID=1974203 RepID=UPI002871724D|nr:histidine kinase N-terminal 7TM domain-containing protein [Gracilimonas sp.]